MKPKVVVILGPTATGKSDLAVDIALRYNGEVISADSRQVYTGLNIGTGKITKKEMRGVTHHLLDVVSPKKVFTVAQYKMQAEKAIRDIVSRGKLPIVCGGTGFYIDSLVYNAEFPDVEADPVLRATLSKQSPEKLFKTLLKLDPVRAKNIDKHNPVRLIRAIEIAKTLGAVPKLSSKKSPYSLLLVGLDAKDDILKKRIVNRLEKRLESGMVKEAQTLRKKGLSWKRFYSLGLEYRHLANLLQKKINREEFVTLLSNDIWHFVKRQRAWFKRNRKIEWFDISKMSKVEKRVKKFVR